MKIREVAVCGNGKVASAETELPGEPVHPIRTGYGNARLVFDLMNRSRLDV